MRIGVKVARCSLEAEIGVRIPDPQQIEDLQGTKKRKSFNPASCELGKIPMFPQQNIARGLNLVNPWG